MLWRSVEANEDTYVGYVGVRTTCVSCSLVCSGNDMSDRGARALARTLMYNTKLR